MSTELRTVSAQASAAAARSPAQSAARAAVGLALPGELTEVGVLARVVEGEVVVRIVVDALEAGTRR